MQRDERERQDEQERCGGTNDATGRSMGPLTWFYMYNFRATLRPFHAKEPPREPPVVDSEATAAVLLGAESIWTIWILLRVWSQPPVGHLDDFLATSSTGTMRRGEPVQ